ncbi:MAG: decarboxylating 6-phosphogluconate dehydrogenase [Candidatus Firestonebacteria bacterium]|nr:decarboxylating 6-phosphogluconate dehydrogenase [Candidatus Firestonebacteria bacterium]
MEIGFIGLGKMGTNMVERLILHDHKIVAFDLNKNAVKEAEKKGAIIAESINDFVSKLALPRIIWIMITAGDATEDVINSLLSILEKDDIVIDGGNSNYKDSIRRRELFKKYGIKFLDVGTSGGILGLKTGYCMMIGGDEETFKIAEPIFKSLAHENGYAYIGKSGSGHFVKMVHNGIEYALLQSYAEGFEIMKAKKEFNLDLAKISRLWNHGSIIHSRILELAADIFENNPELENIQGYVEDSGEGRWIVGESIEKNIPAPLITLSLFERFRSRQDISFSAKVIAVLRNKFGGHVLKE